MSKYFKQRMDELGITPGLNFVLSRYTDKGQPIKDKKKYVKLAVFESDSDDNVVINYHTLQGAPRSYKRGNNKFANTYRQKRLKVPRIKADGSEAKYDIPKGATPFPFLTPGIIEKYNNKEMIKTLVLTEGAFKAFKGYVHGLDVIALASISTYKDKDTQMLHGDILDVIKVCKVQHVIWLADADCTDLSKKWEEGNENRHEVDLYQRPNSFYQSARNIRQLLSDTGVDIHFAHPQRDSVPGGPKGLDDLYIMKMATDAEAVKKKADRLEVHKASALAITTDLMALGKPPAYFHRIDITSNPQKLRNYFHLKNAKDFYDHYQTEIKEFQFTYHGTKYQYNEHNKELEVKIPMEAKSYMRVGDQYHKWIMVPNKHSIPERRLDKRQKQTIVDDHGKHIINHIMKLEGFCNVPDHENYQEIIRNCLNRYQAFEHEPAEMEEHEDVKQMCSTTLQFLGHIFGTNKIQYKRKSDGKVLQITELDLGLDYMQQLYRNPAQVLPILCLVSRENMTGKSTFFFWEQRLFTQNMAVVGNADLANDFNAGWATKLIIACDETKIDKHVVVEKIKSLSTADKIMMNQKGKDHVQLDFFGKFQMASNHEDNFIYASDEDTRYWIRKINRIPEDQMNVNLLREMEDEIPYFLAYLQRRKMATENEQRMWFATKLIETEALRKVVLQSKPQVEKQIRLMLQDMFLDFGDDVIMMNTSQIDSEFMNNKFRNDQSYLHKILTDYMEVKKYMKEDKIVTHRWTYPAWRDVSVGDGKVEPQRVDIKGSGRPWVFNKEDYVTKEDLENTVMDTEMASGMAIAREIEKDSKLLLPAVAGDTGADLPF